MALGPGKYDSLCSLVRTLSNAQSAMIIIIGGEHGDGFSVQTTHLIPANLLAEMLRNMAKQIEDGA